METVAGILFEYLRDVIYNASKAALDIEALPDDFKDFGKGLQFFATCVNEACVLAKALSKGDLDVETPPSYNEIAAPLKSLHASLKHLTWQAQQIEKGDYLQQVDFMGDFSKAFNSMSHQLEERRKLDTRERSKLNKYLNQILLTTPNIILSFDCDGKAIFASETYFQLYNAISAEDLQGKSFSDLFSPFASQDFITEMSGLIDKVKTDMETVVTEQELHIAHKGDSRVFIVHISPMFFETETFMGVMLNMKDMTDIVRARELAEQSARAKSDFLARMSHEMRTPMNAIIGMANIGMASKAGENRNHAFTEIELASTHLLGVINDVLDMSIIEAGKLELSLRGFRFDEMLHKVHSVIDRLAAEKGHTLTVDVDDGIPPDIVSDEMRLVQVLVNLLSNAVKFTPERGMITLTVRKVAQENGSCTILFAVRDNGIGISEEQQKLLFTPFEQIDGGSSRRFGGSGLGLAISKSIVEKMGGGITLDSTPGRGSTFTFEITAQILTETGGDTSDEYNEPFGGLFSDKRILIAEDVEINREIISALLENTGISIDFAVNGQDAVACFTASPDKFDLIMMDIQMPVIDGYEATRQIRSSGFPKSSIIPIIAMTANVLDEDVRQCIEAGMNSHLGKPVDIDEVIAKLKEYLTL